MGKEFKKKFMHPTRRKLVDMVKTGEYEKTTQVGYEKSQETRNVGDVWEDEHHRYEKKDGYTVKTGKNSKVFEDIRKYLASLEKCNNNDCKHVGKFSLAQKKSIKEFGHCIDCMAELSVDLKEHGIESVPKGSKNKPYFDTDEGWQIYIWEEDGYVCVMEGKEVCSDEFSTWFKVNKKVYYSEWKKIISSL